MTAASSCRRSAPSWCGASTGPGRFAPPTERRSSDHPMQSPGPRPGAFFGGQTNPTARVDVFSRFRPDLMSEMGPGRVKIPAPSERVEGIPERLRIMKLNHTAQIRLDTLLENCIFYISAMYEFSHDLGHSRRFGFVRFRGIAD